MFLNKYLSKNEYNCGYYYQDDFTISFRPVGILNERF